MAAERPLEASTVSMGLASMGTNHSTNGYQTRLVLKITILLRDQTQPSDQKCVIISLLSILQVSLDNYTIIKWDLNLGLGRANSDLHRPARDINVEWLRRESATYRDVCFVT